MRQRIALSAVVLAGAALLASPAVATADPAPSGTLGTPGTPNCVGQTNSALARAAGPHGTVGSFAPGIGNAARFSGLTVPEAQALVKAYCEG